MSSPFSKKGKLILKANLSGHRHGIFCIAAHPKASLVAAGGTEGTFVWDLETFQNFLRPGGAAHRGPTTSLLWMLLPDEPDVFLVSGTQQGFISIWKQNITRQMFEEIYVTRLHDPTPTQSLHFIPIPPEITAMAWDPSTFRLAICTCKGLVQVHTFHHRELRPIFTEQISTITPVHIAFSLITSKGDLREVMLFDREAGQILTIYPDGAPIGSRFTGTRIGSASLNTDKNFYCIDVPEEGVSIFRLDDDARVRTFPVPSTREKLFARRVTFVNMQRDDDLVLSGSDHDKIYLFHRGTGELFDILPTGFGSSQQVATSKIDGKLFIFAADERDVTGGNPLQVWTVVDTVKPAPSSSPWSAEVALFVKTALRDALVGLIVITFLYTATQIAGFRTDLSLWAMGRQFVE
ncbi:WD40-repeat-containing domain protein [Flagelloscypha sp. PMI_526]|nr:WD40-repeat-containing domain protein [Flagelloscypha sp. PMI_526]